MDFTTMDDTAAYTAAAALDPSTPAALRIASFRVSPNDLVRYTTDVLKDPFQLVRMGTREELAARNKAERAAHPEGENELYPRWQQGQYMHSMFSTHHVALDNDRYPDLRWTTLEAMLPPTRSRRCEPPMSKPSMSAQELRGIKLFKIGYWVPCSQLWASMFGLGTIPQLGFTTLSMESVQRVLRVNQGKDHSGRSPMMTDSSNDPGGVYAGRLPSACPFCGFASSTSRTLNANPFGENGFCRKLTCSCRMP